VGRIQLEKASIGAISRRSDSSQNGLSLGFHRMHLAEKVEAHLKISSTSEILSNTTGNKAKKTWPVSGRYPQPIRAHSALAMQDSFFLFTEGRTQARNAREAGFE